MAGVNHMMSGVGNLKKLTWIRLGFDGLNLGSYGTENLLAGI